MKRRTKLQSKKMKRSEWKQEATRTLSTATTTTVSNASTVKP